MKIFITGIKGFVGSHCAVYFASAGHEVFGIGRKDSLPAHVPVQCRYTRADICQPLPTVEADIVIHAAALASDLATYEEAYRANVEGTKHVLAACKNATHFIHISSSSVYDFSDGEPKKEEDAGKNYHQLSSYGKTKWLAEELVTQATHFTKTTILRPRAIYGKHDCVLLPRLLRLVKGKRLLLPAHLSHKISLTYVGNLIKAIEACLHKQTDEQAIYNVADDKVYSLHNILPLLLPAVTAKPLRVVNIPSRLFDIAVRINEKYGINPHLNSFAVSSLLQQAVLDIGKINCQLGYLPAINFDDQFKELVSWIHNEEGWRYYFASAPKI